MPRIIFVNRYYAPDYSATAQLLTDLAEDLALEHRQVLVLTSRQRYDDPKAGLPRSETLEWVEVRRLRSTRFGRSRLGLRAFDYLSFYLAAALRLLFVVRRGDLVVMMTDPPMLSALLWPAVKLKGGGLVNWLQDLFPEVAVRLGVMSDGLVARCLSLFRDIGLKLADANVVVGEIMADSVSRRSGRSPAVIANWANGQLIHPVAPEDNQLRKQWGLHHSFVVGYSGNLGLAHPVSAFKQLIDHYRDSNEVRFLFIGGGAGLELLRTWCQQEQHEHVTILGYQPRESLAESLSVADVHLVSLAPELEGLIVPSKLYGIMAVGRPILFLGNPHGEVARVLEEFGCGYAVDPELELGVDATLDMLRGRPKLRLAMGERARQALEAHYDRPTAIRAWMEVLDAVAAKRGSGDDGESKQAGHQT